MRKLMLMVAMIVLTGLTGFTQVFEKGSQVVNVGIGFGNTAYFGSYYSGFLPSFSGSYEYGIVEIPMGSELTGVVSAGGYLGWSTSKYDYGWDDVYYRYYNFIIAARANYHFIFHDKLDTYAGVWFGGNIVAGGWKGDGSHPDDDDWDADSSGPAGGVYVGARWYFNDNFAVYSELGYLISVFNVGVTFKIK
jgi:hypothetical protein